MRSLFHNPEITTWRKILVTPVPAVLVPVQQYCISWNPQQLCCLCHPTGSMWSDGRISIGQCDLVESWDNLSLSQKKNLNYRYQMGCECRVSKGCSLSSHPYLSFVPLSKLSWDTTSNTEMILLCLSSLALAQNSIPLRCNVNSLHVQRDTANSDPLKSHNL